MATGILHIDMGDISFETGYGVPVHANLIGSLFVDVVGANLYQNKDGIVDWQVVGTGGTGGTSNSFSVFSGDTGAVTATAPEQTMIFSGININILTDDTSKTITFSAATGGGGGGVPPSANTFVNSFTYNNANKLTITRNDAVSFDVNLDVFTGITVNGDLTVTGDTFLESVTANTIEATTISAQTISAGTFVGDGSGLSGVSTTDTFVTGFTYDNANNFTISRNDGTSFIVNVDTFTGLTINGNLTVTGDTTLNTVTANSLSATTISADTITANTFVGDGSGLSGVSTTDIYMTAFTYNNANTITIDRNDGSGFTVNISTLTGLTINGDLNVTGDTILDLVTASTITSNTISASTISGGTFYGDGSQLSGVSKEDNYVTGGTYNSGTTSIHFSGTNAATTFIVDVEPLVTLDIVDIDRVNNNTSYIGYGEANACKIQKINTSGGGYSSTWANGDDTTLDKIWANRLSYTYF